MLKNFYIKSIICIALILPFASPITADEAPFYPSWKLMSRAEKRQFLAGYLVGFQDARVLGEIAAEYVKRNPANAEISLRDLLSHYRLSRLAPDILVPKIDEFYSNTKNQSTSLRVAIGQASR